MCTTCKKVHSAEFECLNVLVSSNHLHNIHTPVGNVTIRMEPDPQHIEWVTALMQQLMNSGMHGIVTMGELTRLCVSSLGQAQKTSIMENL